MLDRSSSSSPTGPESVAEWRLEVLERAFKYMFALLAVVLAVEAALSLRSGQWHALPTLSVSVVLQAVAAWGRSLKPHFRAGVFAGAAVFGVGSTLPVLGFGFPVPFIVACMTLTLLALCVSQHFALVSLGALVFVMLAGGAFLSFAGDPALEAAMLSRQSILEPTVFSNWLRVTAIFAAVCATIIVSVGLLVRRLGEAVHHNARLFGSLAQASAEKVRALEQRQILEDKVRRANELQVLGLLSATVAHDFNNLLMIILGNASFLQEELQGRAKEELGDIQRAGEQAADLCRRLLTIGRERISGTETTDLNEVLDAELPLLRRLAGARVTIEWKPGPPLLFKCARTEMRQILLNLCANARDAMASGGRLRISTQRVERKAPGAESETPFGCLVLADEGAGMDAATQARLFEPFFTTKGKAKGTGLGMVVVAAAVEQHAGHLEVESAPGKGTTFSLFFPLVDDASGTRLPATDVGDPKTAGRETILVVDDDEAVLRMLTRYLEKHGYFVRTASNGAEALRLLSEGPAPALVVSDAVMPEMGGRELFSVVNEERPSLPFLFCSGFPAGTIAADILEPAHRGLLAKPFSEEALIATVRQLIASRPARR